MTAKRIVTVDIRNIDGMKSCSLCGTRGLHIIRVNNRLVCFFCFDALKRYSYTRNPWYLFKRVIKRLLP